MKKLTAAQIQAIQELAEYPVPISRVDVEFLSDGTSRITIVSELNADWNRVDQIIHDELDESLPDLEYYGKPIKYSYPVDESETREMYFINFEGESLIRLIMRTKDEPRAWTAEKLKTAIIGVDLAKSEDMTGNVRKPWTLEEILKREG